MKRGNSTRAEGGGEFWVSVRVDDEENRWSVGRTGQRVLADRTHKYEYQRRSRGKRAVYTGGGTGRWYALGAGPF